MLMTTPNTLQDDRKTARHRYAPIRLARQGQSSESQSDYSRLRSGCCVGWQSASIARACCFWPNVGTPDQDTASGSKVQSRRGMSHLRMCVCVVRLSLLLQWPAIWSNRFWQPECPCACLKAWCSCCGCHDLNRQNADLGGMIWADHAEWLNVCYRQDKTNTLKDAACLVVVVCVGQGKVDKKRRVKKKKKKKKKKEREREREREKTFI